MTYLLCNKSGIDPALGDSITERARHDRQTTSSDPRAIRKKRFGPSATKQDWQPPRSNESMNVKPSPRWTLQPVAIRLGQDGCLTSRPLHHQRSYLRPSTTSISSPARQGRCEPPPMSSAQPRSTPRRTDQCPTSRLRPLTSRTRSSRNQSRSSYLTTSSTSQQAPSDLKRIPFVVSQIGTLRATAEEFRPTTIDTEKDRPNPQHEETARLISERTGPAAAKKQRVEEPEAYAQVDSAASRNLVRPGWMSGPTTTAPPGKLPMAIDDEHFVASQTGTLRATADAFCPTTADAEDTPVPEVESTQPPRLPDQVQPEAEQQPLSRYPQEPQQVACDLKIISTTASQIATLQAITNNVEASQLVPEGETMPPPHLPDQGQPVPERDTQLYPIQETPPHHIREPQPYRVQETHADLVTSPTTAARVHPPRISARPKFGYSRNGETPPKYLSEPNSLIPANQGTHPRPSNPVGTKR